MGEYRTRLILDGGIYKLSYTQNGKQQKISIASDKDVSLLGARKIATDVEELLVASYGLDVLRSMMNINVDAKKAGYSSRLIKYSNAAIDLAIRVMYPEQYREIKALENVEMEKKASEISKLLKPLDILNVGCTAVGKTRFILGAILSPEEFRNFGPSLTSVKETTACSIVYHINSKEMAYESGNDFVVKVFLKEDESVKSDIQTLIIEAFQEYIEAIRSKSKDNVNEMEIREEAITAVKKRLELNCDKTFGLGQRSCNSELAEKVESLVRRAILDYYGNSKSIDRIADEDENYIIKQLVKDFRTDNAFITTDDIFAMISQYTSEGPFVELVLIMYKELANDLEKFNSEYKLKAVIGDGFAVQGVKKDSDTMVLLSHIFGNKKLQRNGEIYTIEPLVKNAEFFIQVESLQWLKRELILSDSVGINQGDKDSKRKKDIAFRRVQESIQERKPDIIIYHTRLITNDDYLLDIIRELNVEGYGKSTYVIAGRLDTALQDRLEPDGIGLEELSMEEFNEFIQEVKDLYVEKDRVSLSALIGNNYLICDKTNCMSKKLPSADVYECPNVLKSILKRYKDTDLEGIKYHEIELMEKLEKNYICENVYSKFLEGIPEMIPLNYSSMRWNTLQKAIETLNKNGWGFDSLYPALSIRNIIANELKKSETGQIFTDLFEEKADNVLQRYLIQVAETAQVVLVTEYKTFMMMLLKMRYDKTLRTDLSTSMTNDRKYNLQRLYRKCLEQEGMRGEYSMKMVFHIAWLRTVDIIQQEISK